MKEIVASKHFEDAQNKADGSASSSHFDEYRCGSKCGRFEPISSGSCSGAQLPELTLTESRKSGPMEPKKSSSFAEKDSPVGADTVRAAKAAKASSAGVDAGCATEAAKAYSAGSDASSVTEAAKSCSAGSDASRVTEAAKASSAGADTSRATEAAKASSAGADTSRATEAAKACSAGSDAGRVTEAEKASSTGADTAVSVGLIKDNEDAPVSELKGPNLYEHKMHAPDFHKPNAPERQADRTTSDGAQVWMNAEGQIACLKTASGNTFRFNYDDEGELRSVREPDGSILNRRDDDRFVRRSPDGSRQVFEGKVEPQEDGSVTYKWDNGQSTRYDGNGAVCEFQAIDSKSYLTKVTEPDGKFAMFSYDNDGKPFSIEYSDWSWHVQGNDNNWYKSVPNDADYYQPVSIDRDDTTGSVTIKGGDSNVVYDARGAHRGLEN